MVAYKDILNTFGWDTSYADRFQAAALKWDSNAMASIAKEYKNAQGGWTTWAAWTYTPPTQETPTYNQGNGNLGNWNYQDNSNDRQEQIVSNLNEAYQQNPDQFKDWATFSQNFNYDTAWRSDKQKETMRNWYSQYKWDSIDYNDSNNTDYFFGQLMWWQQLWWTWAAIDAARNRYNAWKVLSGMTPDQIVSAVSSNSISAVWQEMQDLKQYSPALYAQVQATMQWQTAVNDINAVWEWIYKWLTDTETNTNYTNYNMSNSEYAKNASVIKQYNESLYKKIEWLGWDTAAYVAIVASMLQNPAIQSSKNEVEDLEWEINKIQEQIYTVWDSARTALWSEAPEDLVSAYISQQTKNLQNQLRTAQNSLLVAQGKLNNQLSEVDTMIDAINYGLKTYWEGWTWTSWSNYQYVSWSKYQDAGYFDKSTWQFYKLWETPDSRDYQTDDPARLQEIRDNLDAIADSDDAYVFRDRNAFNDYFKYSQRWAAQKAVLDEFWNANAATLKPIADQKYKEYQAAQAAASKWSWWGSWWGWGWSSDYSWIKKALMNWTFSWSWTTTNLKKYWYKWWADDSTILKAIWQTSTPDEISQIVSHLADSKQINTLLYWYIMDAHKSEIQSKLDWMKWINKWKKRKNYIAELYTSLWVPTKVDDKRVNSLLLKFWYWEEEEGK